MYSLRWARYRRLQSRRLNVKSYISQVVKEGLFAREALVRGGLCCSVHSMIRVHPVLNSHLVKPYDFMHFHL